MNSGISFKKKQNLWIWKAVDYETGQLLDWELVGRDVLTCHPVSPYRAALSAPIILHRQLGSLPKTHSRESASTE